MVVERFTKKLRVERASVPSQHSNNRKRGQDNLEGKAVSLGLCIRNYPE